MAVPPALLSIPIMGRLTPIRLPENWRVDYFRARDRNYACQDTLKALGQAIKMYQSDYDFHLPPVVIGGPTAPSYVIWPYKTGGPPVECADALLPYTQSMAGFDCPEVGTALPHNGLPGKVGFTDYWMNRRVSGFAASRISLPQSTILLGDGGTKTDINDASYNKAVFPSSWIADRRSPAYRHLGGTNYLLVDGHIEWLRPQEVRHYGNRSDPFVPR